MLGSIIAQWQQGAGTLWIFNRFKSQQSHDEATEMGGVEVVNNPKNVLLPNPKGSLKSKYSGNYERDSGYTPVIPKSKRRQMNLL